MPDPLYENGPAYPRVVKLLVCVLAAALVAGCARLPRGVEDPDVFFPTHAERSYRFDTFMLAATGGRLVERDGCVLLELDGFTQMVIWPYGWRVERVLETGRLRIHNRGGVAVAQIGDEIVAGGGSAPTDVQRMIGGSVPRRCIPDDGFFSAADEQGITVVDPDRRQTVARPSHEVVVRYPTHAGRAEPTMTIEGTLVVREDCLLIESTDRPGKMWLPMWPQETAFWSGIGTRALVDEDGRVLFREGDAIRADAGEVSRAEGEEMAGERLPEDCGVPFSLVFVSNLR